MKNRTTFDVATRLRLAACAWACLLAVPASLHAADAPAVPSTRTFFELEDMDEPVMSPRGDALAIRVRNAAGRRQLVVMDTRDPGKTNVAAVLDDRDIGEVTWVNNERLLYRMWNQQESTLRSGRVLFGAAQRNGTGMGYLSGVGFSRVDGDSFYELQQLVRTLDGDSDDIIAAFWSRTSIRGYGNRAIDSLPRRYSTGTLESKPIFPGRVPHDIQQWLFDEHGKLQGAVSNVDGDVVLYAVDEQFQLVERRRFSQWHSTAAEQVGIVGVATDGRLYVTHSPGGPNGALGLYRLDLATGQLDAQPLVAAKGFDVRPTLIEDRARHQVIGVRYTADAETTAWLDPEMKALQAKVDALLPGRVNRVEPAACGCAKRVLVTSFSDRQPQAFYLFDRADGQLLPIGVSRPGIDARQMAGTDFVHIQARDGHDLPVYVTRPQGKGPWPTVVLVHGGPVVRGWSWQWDPESQFLAAHGYLVVKPEFRGSAGYGDALRNAGLRQWGLLMQDDIADATTWAAKQGLADPARTCIAGGSYGGYATLMGLVRYADLYRCGVAWSAVSDLTLQHDIYWSDASDDYRENGMPVLIGDPEKDAAQFAATSPLKQAARITRPLLLAHGGIDRRVPVGEAIRMRDALRSAHAPVTWIEYPDEGHTLSKPEARIDFYDRMAAFLDANIGPGAAKADDAAR